VGASGWVHRSTRATPLNAHNRYVFLSQPDNESATVVSAADGKVIFGGVPFSRDLTVWDANDDDVYYYILERKYAPIGCHRRLTK
jgi:hypothetical protein